MVMENWRKDCEECTGNKQCFIKHEMEYYSILKNQHPHHLPLTQEALTTSQGLSWVLQADVPPWTLLHNTCELHMPVTHWGGTGTEW